MSIIHINTYLVQRDKKFCPIHSRVLPTIHGTDFPHRQNRFLHILFPGKMLHRLGSTKNYGASKPSTPAMFQRNTSPENTK